MDCGKGSGAALSNVQKSDWGKALFILKDMVNVKFKP